MKLKYIVISALALSLTGLVVYRYLANAEQDSRQGMKKPKIATVDAVVIKPQYFKDNISLAGSIEADEQIEIRSEVSGIIQTLNFQEGSFVQKGQLLIKINDVELQAQLTQAKTKENLAKENARRAKLLLEKEAISQEEYDIVTSEYHSAKAQTQFVNSQISRTVIKAPFSGKIGLRNVSQGAYVTPTTLISKLVKSSDLKLTFSIPQKYTTSVKPNTEVDFTISGSSEIHKATVYAMDPEIDSTTRTMRVRARFTNPENKILPGGYANVMLPLSESNDAIIIPTEAVIPVQNGKVVFIKQQGKVNEVKVETSKRTDKDVIVINGLKVGDTLITSGMMTLKNGAPVNVKLKSE